MMTVLDQGSTTGKQQPSESSPDGAEGAQDAAVQAEPEYPMTIRAAGGSRTRLLLLLLALVAAGGAYRYFMTEEPPAAVNAPAPLSNSVTVSPPPRPAALSPSPVAPPVPAPAAPATPPAAVKTVAAPPPAPVAAAAQPAAPAATAAAAWQVETGSYRNEAALKAAVSKLRTLGCDPQVSTSHTTVAMTRLRVGTFSAGEFREKLATVRAISPDAFVLRSGDSYTVYAGSYVESGNIRGVTQRLASAGIPVEKEPVQAPRALSRVRCVGFADEAAATATAARLRAAGLRAELVKPH